MKNKLKKLWKPLLIGLMIFTAACNKDNDDEPGKTILLTKLTWSNTNQSGEIVYEYDNQNRPITITEESNETINISNISYNSNGKVSERVISQNGVETMKILYTNANNLTTILLHTKNDGLWVEGPKMEYTIDVSGEILKMQSFYKVDGEYKSDSYQLQNWEGGNIVNQETWGIKDNKINTILTEFDDKNSPYASFGIVYGLNGFYKNNMKETTAYNEADVKLFTNTYFYEYNSYNYPSKSWQSKINEEDIADPVVYVYEYTIR